MLPPGGGRLSERADRRLSRRTSQQSVSSLTSDLWDRSSADTPGTAPPCAPPLADTRRQANGVLLFADPPFSPLTHCSPTGHAVRHPPSHGVPTAECSSALKQETDSLCLCVTSCLSSSPSGGVPGSPDAAAAAAVSRLHAPDQHVVSQIGHFAAALHHHGTLPPGVTSYRGGVKGEGEGVGLSGPTTVTKHSSLTRVPGRPE